MKKTPLQIVKERFESKEKLLEALASLTTEELWLDRLNEEKGLARVANGKLLRLHDTLTAVKEKFGSRAALIDEICKIEKRTDEGYRTRLSRFPTPRLWDHYKATDKRARRATEKAAKAPEAPKKKLARSKKAQAKARAASSG